jgi:prepilin-type N-terminal cleavage/methylation domain-containing protein
MKHGFSQIELLAAVAIAAIVAAAAVPNFLEAKTRAQVGRAKADLYTMAVAVEAYALDYGVVPLDGDDNNAGSIIPFRTTTPAELGRNSDIFPTCTPGESPNTLVGRCYNFRSYLSWRMLTTPVAYLPEVRIDAFSELIPYGRYDNVTNANPPAYCMLTSCGPDRTISNDTGRIGDVAPGTTGFGGRLISGFPSATSGLERSLNNIYDPSNGTTSYGEIYRLCAVKNLSVFYSFSVNNANGHGFGFPFEAP